LKARPNQGDEGLRSENWLCYMQSQEWGGSSVTGANRNLPESAPANKLRPIAVPKKQTAPASAAPGGIDALHRKIDQRIIGRGAAKGDRFRKAAGIAQ